jgi:hypothetical protein
MPYIPRGFRMETGPPFSHQPEDRAFRTARLYGFSAEMQAAGALDAEIIATSELEGEA